MKEGPKFHLPLSSSTSTEAHHHHVSWKKDFRDNVQAFSLELVLMSENRYWFPHSYTGRWRHRWFDQIPVTFTCDVP